MKPQNANMSSLVYKLVKVSTAEATIALSAFWLILLFTNLDGMWIYVVLFCGMMASFKLGLIVGLMALQPWVENAEDNLWRLENEVEGLDEQH